MSIPKKHFNKINKFVNRYDRNHLKNAGHSLTFFDTSALGKGGLNYFTDDDGSANIAQQQAFLNFCKAKKIRPVLSSSSIGELIKGLPNGVNKQRGILEQKKKEVLRVFQESELLWALPINAILDLEHCNLSSRFSSLAHDYLRIFSQYPLISYKKNRNLKHYSCDQYLNYSLWPDYHTVIHSGDSTKWLEDEILPELDTIKEDHRKCATEIAAQINDKIDVLLLGKANMDHSPFIFIWSEIRQSHHKTMNDRIDAFYGAFALSYCDYFVVDDETLHKLIKDEKEKRNLKVEVIKSKEFLKIN
jgi:hypothetical protein